MGKYKGVLNLVLSTKFTILSPIQGSKLTGVLLPGACKIWLGQLKSSGQLPQWATGFLHAGQLLELGSNNKNNNLNHLEIIKKTENQEKLSFLYVAKQ